ncbi:MAG: helix-turn-helix domain-containing protein [Streptosporangiaceae bacterium]
MDQRQGWAAREAAAIGRRVARHRQLAGISAKNLADRCAELGLPSLTREVIAKIENRRRESISVAELQILARALSVSPADLAFPVGESATVEQLPDLHRDTWSAVLWWAGFAARPGRPAPAIEAGAVHLYQVFYQLLADWTFASGEHRRTILASLSGIRGDLVEHGLILPDLPPDVAQALAGYEAAEGDDGAR